MLINRNNEYIIIKFLLTEGKKMFFKLFLVIMIFMLPTLIAIVLTVMGIIKPSIFIKNKEIKWKRLKIGAFGTVISLVSLMIFCGFFAAEPENQNQHQASTQTPSQEQAEIQPKEQAAKTK